MTKKEQKEKSRKEVSDYMIRVLDKNINKDAFEETRKGKLSQKIVAAVADAIAESFLVSGFRYGYEHILGFNGRTYEKLNERAVRMIVSGILKLNGISSEYYVNNRVSISSFCIDTMTQKEFKPTKGIISMNNGIMNIDTFEFVPHDEKFETITSIDIDYDPDAKCPLFEKFLEDVLPDENVRQTVQEIFGSIFIDRSKIKYEYIAMMLGTGSNGKSVLFEVIEDVLGKNNISNFSIYDLTEHPNSDYKIAYANGKMLNYCSDMDKKDISGGKFKALVSGESIPARFPNEKPFMADMLPVLIANLNSMPITSDNTNGDFRRKVVIPFNRTFTKEEADKELPSKIKKERVGVLNWIIEGTKRMRKNKGNLTWSDVIDNANIQARIDGNSTLSFLRESNINPKDAGGTKEIVLLSEVFTKYKDYCNMNNFKACSLNKFSAALRGEGFEYNRQSTGYYISYYINPLDENGSPEKYGTPDDKLPF